MKHKIRLAVMIIPLGLLFISFQEVYYAEQLRSHSPQLTMGIPGLRTAKNGLAAQSNQIGLPGARFCDGSNDTHPCIFDLGLHKGQDTLLYLTKETARVVAVDANGEHVRAAAAVFSEQINGNRLRLVHVAVGPSREGATTFWVNKVNDAFSSLNETLGCRDAIGRRTTGRKYCAPVLVRAQRCVDLIADHGTPHYLKCDIEGMDRACLRSLSGLHSELLPRYVSFAGVHREDIDALMRLGYRRFKVVNQAVLDATAPMPGLRGNSGPWGEAAHDYWLSEKWHDGERLKRRLPMPTTVIAGSKEINAWYDLHAAF